MASREEFFNHLWKVVINPHLREESLDNIIANFTRQPNDPLGNMGATVERILAAGASRSDLCLVLRYTAFEAVFGTLFAFSEVGVDENEDIGTLFEELFLGASPDVREERQS